MSPEDYLNEKFAYPRGIISGMLIWLLILVVFFLVDVARFYSISTTPTAHSPEAGALAKHVSQSRLKPSRP